MTRKPVLAAVALAAALSLGALPPAAQAQTAEAYPSKPISLVVPVPPGGGATGRIGRVAVAQVNRLGCLVLGLSGRSQCVDLVRQAHNV